MELVQLNYKISNPWHSWRRDYFHIPISTILSTHSRQSTSPLSISQLPQNADESSFKHFIKHLAGMKEKSKFKYKQDG